MIFLKKVVVAEDFGKLKFFAVNMLDYTKWERGMLQDKSIKEISVMAMDIRKNMSK